MAKKITHYDKVLIRDEVTDNLSIYNPHAKTGIIMDREEAKELYEFIVKEYRFGVF